MNVAKAEGQFLGRIFGIGDWRDDLVRISGVEISDLLINADLGLASLMAGHTTGFTFFGGFNNLARWEGHGRQSHGFRAMASDTRDTLSILSRNGIVHFAIGGKINKARAGMALGAASWNAKSEAKRS